MSDEITRQQAESIIRLLRLRYDYHRLIACSECQSAPYDPEGEICSDCEELNQIEEALEKWYGIKYHLFVQEVRA
jgi:hypothetical protein